MTTLPRFVALKSNYNNKYLGYVPKEEMKDINLGVEPTRNSFLRFSRDEGKLSPYIKFELVPSAETGNGLVHLRCCYNNKYWVRWSPNHWMIVAAAVEPEEDQSKWSCTLFKPIHVDRKANTVRFKHVQLKNYVSLWRNGAPFSNCLIGGTNELDTVDLSDMVTVIDWESLSTTTAEDHVELPTLVVLKSSYNNNYLGYVPQDEFKDAHQNVEPARNNFLRFSRPEGLSQYAKFEVHKAMTGNGLVHLRCCYNNKYWVRWSQNHSWIVASAHEPEEDQSKWSCTLFKPEYVDRDAKTVRFLHVQLKNYVCLWRINAPFGDCLFGGSNYPDADLCDVVTFTDWDDLLEKSEPVKFPTFVLLQSNYNNNYLSYVRKKSDFKGVGVKPSRNCFLRFSSGKVDNKYRKFQVENAKNDKGLVHLRCCHNNKYWVRLTEKHNWIVAAAEEPEEDKSKWSCTLFKPIYVDSGANTVRFLHVQLGHYACLWSAEAPFGDCLFGGSSEPNRYSCDVVTFIDLAEYNSSEENDSSEEEEEKHDNSKTTRKLVTPEYHNSRLPRKSVKAIASLVAVGDYFGVEGTITFNQPGPSTGVTITIDINSIPYGFHALHVLAHRDMNHGLSGSGTAGSIICNLENVLSDEATKKVQKVIHNVQEVSLIGRQSIVGRTIVIYGDGNPDPGLPLAWGIIGYMS